MGRMGTKGRAVAALGVAFALLAAAAPAHAAGTADGAEKLRRLDIMLMVTGLRCRNTPASFTAEYGRFTTRHMATLNAASTTLRDRLVRTHGASGANRALDRLSTTMANAYGQGHPWLSCAELKAVTANLAEVRGSETLEEAADQLLSGRPSSTFALARR